MKKLILLIITLLVCSVSIALAETIIIPRLTDEEKFTYEKIDDPNDSYKYELSIYINGDTNRKIFQRSGYNFYFKENCQDINERWYLFSTLAQKSNQEQKQREELWYINGNDGYVKILYSASSFSFMINDKASFLCICDGRKGWDYPVLDFYTFPNMELIKTLSYPEYENDYLSVWEDEFVEDYFFIKFRTDSLAYLDVKISIAKLERWLSNKDIVNLKKKKQHINYLNYNKTIFLPE